VTEQLQLRRGTAAQVAAYTPAQGELVVDTSNTLPRLGDGSTAGGWALALATRTAVSDAAYAALVTDRLIAYTALSAARVVTLPSAALYPVGAELTVADESGACSLANTITIARAGSDTINGGASSVLSSAFAFVTLESNGVNAWTVVASSTSGGAALPLQRHAVADANYSVPATVNEVAYTSLTAARVATLPAASAFAASQQLLIVDESGACSATKTITVSRAGSDTINGATSAVLANAYGYVCLASNGANAWTIVDQGQVTMIGDSGSGGAAGYVPAPPAGSAAANKVLGAGGTFLLPTMTGDGGSGGIGGFVPAPPSGSAASNEVLGAGGSWVGQMAGFRNRIKNGAMAIDQRNAGASQTITAAAALAYTIDRFYAYCTGANVTGQRVAGSAPDQYLYKFTGAASVTAIGFAQRIETADSFDLAGQTATLSVELANSVLTTVNWTAYYANSTDTFGTLASPTKTQIATGSFTVNATLTKYSAQIAIPSAATTGIEIVLSVGAQTSGTWQIGEMQLELGQVATPFERRPIGIEMPLCQRYYQMSYEYGTVAGAATAIGSACFRVPTGADSYAFVGFWNFSPEMRVAPALTMYSPGTGTVGKANNNVNGDFAVEVVGGTNVNSKYAAWQANNTASGASSSVQTQNYVHFTASAEL
jgi:hypothetical protein